MSNSGSFVAGGQPIGYYSRWSWIEPSLGSESSSKGVIKLDQGNSIVMNPSSITSTGTVGLANDITVDSISELTLDAGVDVEGVVLKDEEVHASKYVAGVPISGLTSPSSISLQGVASSDLTDIAFYNNSTVPHLQLHTRRPAVTGICEINMGLYRNELGSYVTDSSINRPAYQFLFDTSGGLSLRRQLSNGSGGLTSLVTSLSGRTDGSIGIPALHNNHILLSGTASLTSMSVTATGSVFTEDCVGKLLVFRDGQFGYVNFFNSGTSVEIDRELTTAAAQPFIVYKYHFGEISSVKIQRVDNGIVPRKDGTGYVGTGSDRFNSADIVSVYTDNLIVNDSSFNATITAPTLSSDIALTLPNHSGQLVAETTYSTTINSTGATTRSFTVVCRRQGHMVSIQVTDNTGIPGSAFTSAGVVTLTGVIPAEYRHAYSDTVGQPFWCENYDPGTGPGNTGATLMARVSINGTIFISKIVPDGVTHFYLGGKDPFSTSATAHFGMFWINYMTA